MQLNITARHLELTPALSEYVRKKLEKAQRYFEAIIWAQAILQVQKHRHIAEVIVHTPGNTFHVQAEAGDLYSAVDIAAHKLELHITRLKDKQRHHRKIKDFKRNWIPSLDINDGGTSKETSSLISDVRQVVPEAKSVQQAMKELNSNGLPFSVFLNERTSQVNLIYRKGKGAYGLLQIQHFFQG